MPDDQPAQTKLALEVEKLRLETRRMSESWWKQPGTWIALITLALSAVGNMIQLSSTERNRQIAEIRTEKFDLEAKKTEAKIQELEGDLQKKTKALESAKAELELQSTKLAAVRAETDAVAVYKKSLSKDIDELLARTARALQHVSSGLLSGRAVLDSGTVTGGFSSGPPPKK